MVKPNSKIIEKASVQLGDVEVTRPVNSSALEVWQALTEPEQVAKWFGNLLSKLEAGAESRLDFGDGDFFQLQTLKIDKPHTLKYAWRFLGIGPLDTITWKIAPTEDGCLVSVTDSEAERSPQAAKQLRQGWLDFTNRLVRFLKKGKATRYSWRREFDASIELNCDASTSWDTLFSRRTMGTWLPLGWAELSEGTEIFLRDQDEPSVFRVKNLRIDPSFQMQFDVTHKDWLSPTRCLLYLSARRKDTILNVSHNGWEAISPDRDYQKSQRIRFSRLWVSTLERAKRYIESNASGATADIRVV